MYSAHPNNFRFAEFASNDLTRPFYYIVRRAGLLKLSQQPSLALNVFVKVIKL
jgi:hypothetical protein